MLFLTRFLAGILTLASGFSLSVSGWSYITGVVFFLAVLTWLYHLRLLHRSEIEVQVI